MFLSQLMLFLHAGTQTLVGGVRSIPPPPHTPPNLYLMKNKVTEQLEFIPLNLTEDSR